MAERVHVHCRLRPPADGTPPATEADPDSNTVTLSPSDGRPRSWTFDGVHGPQSSQAAVYDAIAVPVLESVLRGYNGTILAYGQTVSAGQLSVGSWAVGEQLAHRLRARPSRPGLA
eukprot:scaffold315872_cov30-Tisochrysis_lutea.AAC.1